MSVISVEVGGNQLVNWLRLRGNSHRMKPDEMRRLRSVKRFQLSFDYIEKTAFSMLLLEKP